VPRTLGQSYSRPERIGIKFVAETTSTYYRILYPKRAPDFCKNESQHFCKNMSLSLGFMGNVWGKMFLMTVGSFCDFMQIWTLTCVLQAKVNTFFPNSIFTSPFKQHSLFPRTTHAVFCQNMIKNTMPASPPRCPGQPPPAAPGGGRGSGHGVFSTYLEKNNTALVLFDFIWF
jgi:hypothetical protein